MFGNLTARGVFLQELLFSASTQLNQQKQGTLSLEWSAAISDPGEWSIRQFVIRTPPTGPLIIPYGSQ